MRASPELRAALARVDEAFDRKLPPFEALCGECVLTTNEEPRLESFEAVIRTYRARRLELPIRMIWGESFGHGSALVHGSLRRFAWFVPALFATALEDGQLARVLGVVADLAEEARLAERQLRAGAPAELSTEERAACLDFLREALRAAVSAEIVVVREVAAIFAAASGLAIDAQPLVAMWLAMPEAEIAIARALAGEDVSIEQQVANLSVRTGEVVETSRHVDPERALVLALATEEVRCRLESRSQEESDAARVRVLSRAEETIRAARTLS